MKLLTGIMFVISLMACATVPTRQVLDSAGHTVKLVRMTPPKIYEVWWQEIAECEHQILIPHGNVQWYAVSARPFYFSDDSTHTAMDAASDSEAGIMYINITGLVDEFLIKHEEEHTLLYWQYGQLYNTGNTEQTHPSPYYDRCGLKAIGQQAK